MSQAPHALPPIEEFPEYRPLSATAVVGLVLAVLGLAALVVPMLWPLPLAAALVSLWALRRINRLGCEQSGRGLAWAGLLLGIALVASAPSQGSWHRYLVRHAATEVGLAWFDLLAHNETYAAWRLSLEPSSRPHDTALPVDLASDNPRYDEELQAFLQQPIVRQLLALGPQAQVAAEEVRQQASSLSRDAVEIVYRVRFQEGGQPQSLAVHLHIDRVAYRAHVKNLGRQAFAGWRVRLVRSAPNSAQSR